MIRGLIIAIEDYSRATTLARRVTGATNDGIEFRRWLVDVKRAAPEHVLVCATRTCPGLTHRADRSAIIDAMDTLVASARHAEVRELYVLFSGHGFQYEPDKPLIRQNVLVGSNFTTISTAGDACLDVDEIRVKLRHALGPGSHYYFVDACRTVIARGDIDVTSIGRAWGKSPRGIAAVYTLFSTAPGQAASVRSPFGQAIIDALRGRGRAKGWERGRLVVTFNRLVEYLKNRLPNHDIDPSADKGADGRILEVTPIAPSNCEVRVEEAAENDAFRVEVRNEQQYVVFSHTFDGVRYEFEVKPNDYDVEVTLAGTPLLREEPQPPELVDLFESATVRFRKGRPAKPVPEPRVTVATAPHSIIHATNVATGVTGYLRPSGAAGLPPGTYDVQMFEAGFAVAEQRVNLQPGDDRYVDFGARGTDEGFGVREQIWHRFNEGLGLVLSESLGWIGNPDLAVWLSVIGASNIVRPGDRRYTLSILNTAKFDDVEPGDSPVYVMLGADSAPSEVFVALDGGNPMILQRVEHLPALAEARLPAEPGPHRMSVTGAGWQRFSLPVHTLPNRATLVVLAEDGEQPLQIRQMVLPLARLHAHLHARVRDYVEAHSPLQLVYWSATAQRRFIEFREVAPEGQVNPDDPKSPAISFWWDLLYGKWLDPIMAIVASYELIRRGLTPEKFANLRTVVTNLRQYFPGIADTDAIARMLGEPASRPPTPPLFLDGVLGLGVEPESPEGFQLDYSSPWTLWRAEEPETRRRGQSDSGPNIPSTTEQELETEAAQVMRA